MGLGTDFVDMEEIDEAHAGDVVAMFGVNCRSMDTFSDGNEHPTRILSQLRVRYERCHGRGCIGRL